MATLNQKIEALEQEIQALKAKIVDLTNKTESKRNQPESLVPQIDFGQPYPLPSSGTGLGRVPGKQGNVIWNDSYAQSVAWGQQPPTPTKGYNKHFHSIYDGGALDINTLQLVEYEDLDASGHNRYCQGFWKELPTIKKENGVEKIGLLDIAFDPDSQKWVAGSKEIDVERTDLVQYTINPITGEKSIKLDSNGEEMKAPMYGSNENTQNTIWDENAKCWRFFAVYADEEEE